MGTYWYSGVDDNGGVHTNSGVQNFWYYLLSIGKTCTNDLSNAYSVTGIGTDKAAAIAYRSLTVYLTSFSGYSDARDAAIQAATDLYGACSNEVIQTTNAWYAVGVGAKYPVANIVTANATLPATAKVGKYIQLSSTTVNATSLAWYSDAALISNKANDSCRFSTTGAHQITLIASNSVCSDTLIHPITLQPNLAIPGVNSKTSYHVFPNPASNQFTLEGACTAGSKITYQLVDIAGKVVAAKSMTTAGSSFKETISVRQLASGIYSLTVLDNEQISTKQVMIKN